jgi:hypothetical protein
MEIDLRNQNGLLLKNLLDFYKDKNNFNRLLNIVNGNSKISLRLIDWFSTNFSKKYYIIYSIPFGGGGGGGGAPAEDEKSAGAGAPAAAAPPTRASIAQNQRFKVYLEYKLNLKAFSKRRFDPFCRWERISIPVPAGADDSATAASAAAVQYFETTIGQLNFFKWAISNYILDYIEQNFESIEKDMNSRNTVSKKKSNDGGSAAGATSNDSHTRKKREQISVSATQTLKKENVNIVISFH